MPSTCGEAVGIRGALVFRLVFQQPLGLRESEIGQRVPHSWYFEGLMGIGIGALTSCVRIKTNSHSVAHYKPKSIFAEELKPKGAGN